MAISQRELQRARNAQVGLLMRTYRETFVDSAGCRGLTQDQLLLRMAEVSDDYAERYSHATVSRWENGRTRPTLGRLRVFGAALHLEPPDIAGLILLAGLAPDFEIAMQCANGETDFRAPDVAATNNPPIRPGGTKSNPTMPATIIRFAALGIGITAFGYALSLIGWDRSWMPVAYVGFALAVVLCQHFVLPGMIGNLSEFFWVSLFVVLTTPLLQFAPLGMDHYNIYMLADFAGTHYPYMLALLVNLALAFVGTVLFRTPWKWRYSEESALGNALRKAAWSVLPPVCLVYGVTVAISNISVWIQLAVLLPVVAAVFIVLLVLQDPEINPSERDSRFLTTTSMVVTVVTTTLGVITILAIFVSPDLPAVLPDHNLFRSWEIDFTALGYTKEEALLKVNLGYMWHAMCLLAYMVFVLGTYLLLSVYSAGRDSDPASSAGSRSERPAGQEPNRSQGETRIMRR